MIINILKDIFFQELSNNPSNLINSFQKKKKKKFLILKNFLMYHIEFINQKRYRFIDFFTINNIQISYLT